MTARTYQKALRVIFEVLSTLWSRFLERLLLKYNMISKHADIINVI